MTLIIILVSLSLPAIDAISKSGQFSQVNAQFNSLFVTAYTASLSAEAAADERPASGVLFMRARTGDDLNEDALGFQRAIPVVFSPYEIRDPVTGGTAIDPSSKVGANAPYAMTFENYFDYQPYFRPIDDAASVDLPPDVWVAPSFFDERESRGVGPQNVPVQIPQTEFFDNLLKRTNVRMDSRLDRFMIVFGPGGELFEKQADVSPPSGRENDLMVRMSPKSLYSQSQAANQWIMTTNPVTALGVSVYDREVMLREAEGLDRRDYITEHGQPIGLTRFGGSTIVSETPQ